MQLKVDPKLPHHYIIGVEARTALDKKPGELYLKYGPIYFTNKDVVKVQDAKILSEDKLFRTTPGDAIRINKCGDIVHNLWSLRIAAQANQCTVHHFSSEYTLNDEVFETLVNVSNFGKGNKELLDKSRIRL